MKIFKLLFAIALTAMTFTLSASDIQEGELRLKSKVVEDHSIVLQLVNLQQEVTKVSIRSLDGEATYFRESIRKHNGYIRRINLEHLEDGRYLIEVVQNDLTKKQILLIRDGELQLSSIAG